MKTYQVFSTECLSGVSTGTFLRAENAEQALEMARRLHADLERPERDPLAYHVEEIPLSSLALV